VNDKQILITGATNGITVCVLSRKAAHIGADLRHNDLSAQLADSRDCAQPLDGVTKAGQPCIDLPIKLGEASLKRVDLLHMQLKQETMEAAP
jgi:hypothetical protein